MDELEERLGADPRDGHEHEAEKCVECERWVKHMNAAVKSWNHYQMVTRSGAIGWRAKTLVCQIGGRGFDPRSGKICGDLFLALQHWRLCISRGPHDHVND